jgi:hypothetical protein
MANPGVSNLVVVAVLDNLHHGQVDGDCLGSILLYIVE